MRKSGLRMERDAFDDCAESQRRLSVPESLRSDDRSIRRRRSPPDKRSLCAENGLVELKFGEGSDDMKSPTRRQRLQLAGWLAATLHKCKGSKPTYIRREITVPSSTRNPGFVLLVKLEGVHDGSFFHNCNASHCLRSRVRLAASASW